MRLSSSRKACALAVSFVTTVSSLASFSPGPSYSVGIPSGSAISASSTGPLYFQLSAPTSYQWVGLGIGSQMAGSTIFVMYADGAGNVTLSARKGVGEVMPQADSTTQAGITLLAGSGIVDGNMVANVKCTSCQLKSDSTSTKSPWIAAWMTGSALNSNSVSATIAQHAGNAHRQINLDLTAAVMSSDTNPFVASTGPAATSAGSSGTATASSPGSTPTSDSSSGGTGSNTGATVVGNSFSTITTYQKAHGIIAGLTFVILFPLGAIIMRLGASAWAHGGFQIFALVFMLAALGTGVKLAKMTNYLFNTTHTIFGLVIIILFLIQPISGIIHHLQYRRTLSRAPVSHFHIWFGRILMLLGVINGGLGLKLAHNSKKGEIAYGVIAGVVGLAYIAVVVLKRKGNGGNREMPMMMKERGTSGSGENGFTEVASTENGKHGGIKG